MAVSFGAKVFSALRVLARPRINLPLMAALALAGCPDHVKETAVDLGRACGSGQTDKAIGHTRDILRELKCNGIYVGPASDAPSERPEAAPLTDAEIEALVRERPELLGKIEGGKQCDAAPPPPPHFSICSLFNPAPNQNKAVASMRIGQTLSALELRGEALNLFAGTPSALPAGKTLRVVFYMPGTSTEDTNIVATLASTPVTAAGQIALASIEIKTGATTGKRDIALLLDGQEIGRLREGLDIKPSGGGGTATTPTGVDFGPPVI